MKRERDETGNVIKLLGDKQASQQNNQDMKSDRNQTRKIINFAHFMSEQAPRLIIRDGSAAAIK